MELIGDRIVLRYFKDDDFHFYKELELHALTYKYESNAPDKKQVIDSFNTILLESNTNLRNRYSFAVCLKQDLMPIGRVGIKLNWEEIREWEVGWALHLDYWGKGYATEAAKLIIGYAFSQLNAHRVIAFANADNKLSEKVMVGAGMIKDGELRETKWCNGNWRNELIYSVLEKDWT